MASSGVRISNYCQRDDSWIYMSKCWYPNKTMYLKINETQTFLGETHSELTEENTM